MVLGEDDDAAGFTVEPGGHVQALDAQVFAAGPDQTGPGPLFGWMAGNVAGLVDGQDMFVVVNDGGAKFLGG